MSKQKKPTKTMLASPQTLTTLGKIAHALRLSSPDPDPVREMVADPLTWLQQYTRTKDSHWQEAGARGPHRPFPEKPFFSGGSSPASSRSQSCSSKNPGT